MNATLSGLGGGRRPSAGRRAASISSSPGGSQRRPPAGITAPEGSSPGFSSRPCAARPPRSILYTAGQPYSRPYNQHPLPPAPVDVLAGPASGPLWVQLSPPDAAIVVVSDRQVKK